MRLSDPALALAFIRGIVAAEIHTDYTDRTVRAEVSEAFDTLERKLGLLSAAASAEIEAARKTGVKLPVSAVSHMGKAARATTLMRKAKPHAGEVATMRSMALHARATKGKSGKR